MLFSVKVPLLILKLPLKLTIVFPEPLEKFKVPEEIEKFPVMVMIGPPPAPSLRVPVPVEVNVKFPAHKFTEP
ncbi:MAG: hypothetical protein Q8S39_13620, partial [Ignavibacteria bacterium]|nr:hypothetical protein [Ignavibacteria bacterium]